jgi:very-short-patch-repair endonuclease
MRMLSASDTLTRLGGIARGTHLQQLGFDRRALSRLVDRGEIQRIRNGIFAVPDLEQDVRAAAAHGGALSCASELRRSGVWVLTDSAVPHVWLGPDHHAQRHPGCVCVSHYFGGRPPLGRADIETALLHFRRCAGDEAFFAAFESAWRHGMLNRSARARVRASLPQSARWLVDLARPDADSGLESLLRLRLHVLGIRLDCQVVISGIGRVDFVIAGRLIIETDGRENHDGSVLRHKDLVRDAAASRLGYETLRFDYAQVVYDWPAVQMAILAALHRASALV